jgi:branched-subunit amino acid aminotransferase/4-amino-4-deoxychorismate lyase
VPQRLFVDGALVEAIPLGADDPGSPSGLSVFETMRVRDGRAFRLEAHLARLADGAARLGLPAPPTRLLEAELRQVMSEAPEGDHRLRLTLTGGGRRILQLEPLVLHAAPLRLASRVWEAPPWPPADCKHGLRAELRLALVAAGVDELVRLDREGWLIEGTWSNVWVEVEGELRTPPLDGGLLPGVTRAALLELGRAAGLPVAERATHRRAPMAALYVSSALRGLVSVASLDGEALPGDGPIGAALRGRLEAARLREATG